MSTDRKIRVKICGMRDEANIMEVASFNPDYMGFIFYPSSPRYVGENFQMPMLAESVKRVGVFVNEAVPKIEEKVNAYGLTHIQLHGNETVALSAALREKGLVVIKAFSVDDSFDFQITKPFVPVVDYFLFDTKGKFHGGNGTPFNWEILRHYDQEVPFFLSGGLSLAHLAALSDLQHMNLHALDLNSGVEDSPGIKSIEKIKSVFTHPTLI